MKHSFDRANRSFCGLLFVLTGLTALALLALSGLRGGFAYAQNGGPVARLKDVRATGRRDPANLCRALPDLIEADASETNPPPGPNVSYSWFVGPVGMDLVDVTEENQSEDPALLKVELPYARHQIYSVQVVVSVGIPNSDTGPQTAQDQKSTNPTNVPPAVFPLVWHRTENPCEEVTDTPAAETYTQRQSLVATPACGTEADPGVLLNATGAACDADGDPLKFTFWVDGEPHTFDVFQPNPTDPGFQTSKLPALRLPDAATHSLSLEVSDEPGSENGEQYDPLSDETGPVHIVDPREELRQELAGLGFDSIEAFQQEMAPIIERAQADFRLQGWGTGQEMQYYGQNPPVFYSPAPPEGIQPLLLGRTSGLQPPADVSGHLLRLDAWVERPFEEGLDPDQEARGEYFTALLNAETGLIGLEDYANLVLPPQKLPEGLLLPVIYRPQSDTGERCFPRQSVDRFDLPDLLFLQDGLGMLRNAAFVSLGFIPIPDQLLNEPQAVEKMYKDLADLGRLFNDQTVDLFAGADVNQGARHQPQVPRVRVHAAVHDGATLPHVCWSFFDPHCTHNQAQVIVTLDETPLPNIPADARSAALPPLTPGVHSVTVRVADELGFSSERTVQFLIAGSIAPLPIDR
ncbi:MAG: hypothetical protein HY320_01725 [Armatimonadetes bacterium]|nr:hypothetical protein [Armatimonadota bacterium]